MRDRAKDMASDYERTDPAQSYAERRGITFRERVAEIVLKAQRLSITPKCTPTSDDRANRSGMRSPRREFPVLGVPFGNKPLSPLRTIAKCVTCSNTTRGNVFMNDAPADLGDLERKVMQLIWANDHLTADAVRELLGERSARRLKDSTVRTVLRRLEQKGFVAHAVDGRTFVYRATEPRGRVAAKAVKHIVDWFCNGSLDEVLVGMVDNAMLDRPQLQLLIDKIETAKKGKE
ncbi:BlaI/MecI/CopY family transcriptional regulator [Bradyrhizobium sp.]|uniref:BlaI/MecI/CopY family transcriptional regulator n=2 Tax=Bradyrhizobium sp. TaxID=376 RepID=UPI0025BE1F97|nr:BlaI/MecI/CopY family transcriptional regulator [Bradyrhizobium sp.]